jgi:hypothetical protein
MDVFVNPEAPIAVSRYGEAFLDQHGRHVIACPFILSLPLTFLISLLMFRVESNFTLQAFAASLRRVLYLH